LRSLTVFLRAVLMISRWGEDKVKDHPLVNCVATLRTANGLTVLPQANRR